MTQQQTYWVTWQVLDWLEDELELGEYRREFARAKVDGALLLNLEVRFVTQTEYPQPSYWPGNYLEVDKNTLCLGRHEGTTEGGLPKGL